MRASVWIFGCFAMVSGCVAAPGVPAGAADGMLDAGAAWGGPPPLLGCRERFDDDPMRIAPVGDSITQGFGKKLTYRYFLWELLQDTGVPFDFVGSLDAPWGGASEYPNPAFDRDHEGHWGISAAGFSTRFWQWQWQHPPDVVLVHLGTNDGKRYAPPPANEYDVERALDAIGSLVVQLRERNPRVRVGLAKILPAGSEARQRLIRLFDEGLEALAPELSQPDSPVILVDQATGISQAEHTSDSIHPNEAGEREMANRWLVFIERLLDESGLCPRRPTFARGPR